MHKDTSDKSTFPYESVNSFDRHPQDWQNASDVQEFYFEDWDMVDNSLRLNPSLSSDKAEVKAEIKFTKELRAVESFKIKSNLFGSDNNVASLSISEKSIDLHIDQGFRRSAETNFNRYYKLQLNRKPMFSFGRLSAGLNYHLPSGFYTHHELTLLNEEGENKLQYLNTSVMEYWKLRYFSESIIKYGRSVEKTSMQIVSAQLHPSLLLYGMAKSTKGDDKDAYELGAQIRVTPGLHFYTSMLKDLEQVNAAFGAKFNHRDGQLRGKFLLWGLKHFNLFVESQLPYDMRGSVGLRIPIPNTSADKPAQDEGNDFKWGLKLEKSW